MLNVADFLTAPLLQSEAVSTARDITLIAVLLLLFVVLVAVAIMALILFRQVRRMANRMEEAMSRVESGLEKFESVADEVSDFAGSVTGAIGGAGLKGLTSLLSKWFGGGKDGHPDQCAETEKGDGANAPDDGRSDEKGVR